jgi:C4-dicarboxylate transporter DctQ subunit
MTRILSMLDRAVQAMTALATGVAGLFILITALIVTYEVVMRSLFNAPTEWVIEISVYLIVVAGFLGLAVTYAEDKHIRVDLLTSRLPARTGKCLEIAVGVVALAFSLVFLVESWDMVATSLALDRTANSSIRMPLWIPQAALPIGFGLLLLQIIRRILLDIRALAAGRHPAGGQARRLEG